MAGVSDDKGLMCLALALWNGQDPILKERLFGLTNSEGNHGEDVKEYYFYVDNVPTHSWMRWRYKYPQAAFPYDDLLATNRARGFGDQEYELLDTGVFDDGRYFDVAGRLRQGRADGPAGPHHRPQPRRRRGADPPAPHAVVPQHLVVGRASPGSRRYERWTARCRAWRRATTGSATTGCTSATTSTCCSARTRRTPNGCGASPTRRPTSRTASTGPSCTATPAR